MRLSIRLVILASLNAGCSLYHNLVPIPDDMTGCVPSPACGVDAAADMHVSNDMASCEMVCPPGVDMAPDLRPSCVDSSTCPSPSPVCSNGKCGPCMPTNDMGASNECAIYHAPANLCGPMGGCVQCLSKDDCAQFNQTCILTVGPMMNTCGPCSVNADCTTGVCKSGGACASGSEVYYVDNRGAASINACKLAHPTADGTSWATAFCDIADATGAATKRPYVLVKGSATAYSALSLTTTTTETIIGPGRVSPTALVFTATLSPAISVQPTAGQTVTLTIDGLELSGSSGTGNQRAGLLCNGGTGTATVTVRNSLLDNSGTTGVDSSSCTLILDASIVSTNAGGGVKLASTSYTLTNNIISGNGSGSATTAGVSFDNGSTGAFAFNTVVKNTVAAGVGGIDCGTGATKAIQDSIVYQNTTSGGTQLGAQCTLTNVVTVSGDDNRGTMSAQPPAFVSATDFHLDVNTGSAISQNQACCIDKVAAPGTPNANHDVDSSTRPKGTGATPYDVGAHEAM